MKSYKVLNLVLFIINLILLIGIVWVGSKIVSVEDAVSSEPGIAEELKIDEGEIERLKDYKIEEKIEVESDNLLIFQSSSTISKDDSIIEERIEVKESPSKINLPVPFTSQAPEKNWDQPWQDACEEATVLMLDAYYKGYNLSPLFSKDEILKMVDWQDERGWGYSITSDKVKELSEWFLFTTHDSHNTTQTVAIVEDPSIEEIKKFVANGDPVLVLAYGKDLPNPHFSNGGPEYHALIIRGYDDVTGEFITNDPGTQFGENFKYKYDDLMGAIHDWNGGNVENGKKVVLVIE